MTGGAKLDMAHLRGWSGREDVGMDIVSDDLARKYHATFDSPGEAPKAGEIVPRLIHFCCARLFFTSAQFHFHQGTYAIENRIFRKRSRVEDNRI